MGRLDIRICAAKNLPDVQTFGKIDPYCIVKLEHQQHQTSVCDNNESPAWNEIFKFTVADPDSSQLRFELWNKNTLSDDFLGCYTLSIGGLHRGKVKEGWYLLQQCKSNAELHIRMKALDFGEVHPDGEDAQDYMGHQGFIQAPQAVAAAAPGGYPPQQQQAPPQQAPQQGYPPQQVPAQGAYPPQQPGAYPPQQGYPQQPAVGYPPQQAPPPTQPSTQPAPGYPTQQSAALGQCTISYARYHTLDVTAQVQQMAAQTGGHSLNIDGNYNTHFGDPAPGTPKQFTVGLSDGRSMNFPEGTPCNITLNENQQPQQPSQAPGSPYGQPSSPSQGGPAAYGQPESGSAYPPHQQQQQHHHQAGGMGGMGMGMGGMGMMGGMMGSMMQMNNDMMAMNQANMEAMQAQNEAMMAQNEANMAQMEAQNAMMMQQMGGGGFGAGRGHMGMRGGGMGMRGRMHHGRGM